VKRNFEESQHGNSAVAIIHCAIDSPPQQGNTWEERWEAADQGLIGAWLLGIEKSLSNPVLKRKALAGELPLLPWKGGVSKAIAAKGKVGAFHYLATWQGLRGEDLRINPAVEVQLTCSRTHVTVTFTSDIEKLLPIVESE
jgi:hypothetical protein